MTDVLANVVDASALDAAAVPVVRVAVLVSHPDGARLVDLALPTELALRELIPAIRDAAQVRVDETAVPALVSLARVGGAVFDLDATLNTVGVLDGDLLILRPVPLGPPAPPIVEDVADAAAIFAAARHDGWDGRLVRRGATVAVLGVVVLLTALAGAYRIETGRQAGAYVVDVVAIAAVVTAVLASARSVRLATALALTALAPVAAAFALAVPNAPDAARALLAAAGVTAWSVVQATISTRAVSVFTAVATAGLSAAAASCVLVLWASDATRVGSLLVVVASVVIVQSPQLAAWWARLPLPTIPAPGDPTPTAPSWHVLRDLPRRVARGNAHQNGLVAGAVLVSVTGSVVLVVGRDPVSPWAWYLVVAVAAGAVLRARVWDSAPCRAWLLGQPYLVAAVSSVAYAVQSRHFAALGATLVLAVLAVAWSTAALCPAVARSENYSLPLRRLVGLVASAVDASLIPAAAYLVGLFGWVLAR